MEDTMDVVTNGEFQTNGNFIIGNPANYYHTQRNNKLNPYVTCFPTSVAMVINFLLKKMGMSQTAIGIPADWQIEDWLTNQMMGNTMKTWMVQKLGPAFQQYIQKAWIVAKVEEQQFDLLMNKLGYDAVWSETVTFDFLCNMMYHINIPQVIMGNFSKTSTVQGHINCVVGFNYQNKEFIVNDPFGNAYTRYSDPRGCQLSYKYNDFFAAGRNKVGKTLFRVLMITPNGDNLAHYGIS
jgi:hypothetical protein